MTPADAESVLDSVMQWVNDPEVTKNLAKFDHTLAREEERGFLKSLFSSENDRVFAIENAVGDYIGQIGIHQIYWPARNGRIGVVVGRKEEWGKGHARRAMELLLRYAFEDLKLNKVWVIFYKSNERMKHICRRLGFVQEGILLEEYFHQGKFHDMIRAALLQHEWTQRKKLEKRPTKRLEKPGK